MLKSRFHKPKITSDIIYRERIVRLLNQNSDKALILVSAPAGYGKSVAVSHWLEMQEKPYAWLALDKSLNDFTVFLEYFTKALSILWPSLSEKFTGLVPASSLLSANIIAEKVCNELIELEEPGVLVLDDYYYINNKSIHEFIDYILKFHQINQQLVIISRYDPPLKLSRNRLYGKLIEVRIADLVIDTQEFQLLLKHHNRELGEDVPKFLERSEGWILGIMMLLKISAIGKGNLEDIMDAKLSMDMKFLMGEYLPLLPESFSQPLLLAGICDRFNEELLEGLFKDQLKQTVNVQEFISKLKEYNLFLISEDDSDQWFRFHHLFGKVLRRHYNNEVRINEGSALQFISNWFASEGFIEEAIEYIIRKGDLNAASDLVIRHRREVFNKGQWWRVKSWLDQLPDRLIKANPSLLIAQIWVLENFWNRSQVHHALVILGHQIKDGVGDLEKAEYYFHLAYHELFFGSSPGKALKFAEKSRALYEESHMLGARREMVIAFSMQMLGQIDESINALKRTECESNPGEIMYLRSYSTRLFVLLLAGRFVEAREICDHFIYIARNTFRYMEAWSIYLAANIEFQNFESKGNPETSKKAIEYEGIMDWRAFMDNYAGLCLQYIISDDTDAAMYSLMKMKTLQQNINDRLFSSTFISVQMRIHWLLGEKQKALRWATGKMELDMKAVDPLFVIEVPALTRIRILITYGNTEQLQHGLKMLESFESLVHSVHSAYHDIDILLLKALAIYRMGDHYKSKSVLEKAFEVYTGQKITRPFRELMRVAPYLFDQVKDIPINLRHIIPSKAKLTKEPHVFLKDKGNHSTELTLREQEIVRMATNGLRSKEIADQLNISIATVKSHLTHIYQKLDVHNRTSMIQKLRESNPNFS